MRVSYFKQSKYLKRDDVPKPVLLTINSWERVDVAMEGKKPEWKCALYFKELDKPMVCNATNLDMVAFITGDELIENWIGHKVVLYDDPTVMYAGKRVGGLRICAPKQAVNPSPKLPANFNPANDEPDTEVYNEQPDSEIPF